MRSALPEASFDLGPHYVPPPRQAAYLRTFGTYDRERCLVHLSRFFLFRYQRAERLCPDLWCLEASQQLDLSPFPFHRKTLRAPTISCFQFRRSSNTYSDRLEAC